MKIAIFSDCHCGFKFGEERGEDSFKSLEEAIELSRDADLILLAGDVFDTRIPRLEIISRTAKILNKTKFYKSNAKLIYSDKQINHHILGTPIIAIHGTHERRTKELINPIQMLEDTGQLIYLHNSTVIFDINGKKVAIHGMSGVPERYAKSVLMSWNPKPIENAINIFMFHQSIEPYIYSPLEPPTLKPEDLPDGFDLYVLGHLHWHDEKKLKNGILLLTGSTSITSLHKNEANQEKGIYFYNGKELEFKPLKYQRKIFFEEINLNKIENIENEINRIISKIPETAIKPILSLFLYGKPKASIDLNKIEKMLSKKAIVYIKKAEAKEENTFDIKLPLQKISPEEQGIKILKDILKEKNCDIKNIEDIFELLVLDETEKVINELLK